MDGLVISKRFPCSLTSIEAQEANMNSAMPKRSNSCSVHAALMHRDFRTRKREDEFERIEITDGNASETPICAPVVNLLVSDFHNSSRAKSSTSCTVKLLEDSSSSNICTTEIHNLRYVEVSKFVIRGPEAGLRLSLSPSNFIVGLALPRVSNAVSWIQIPETLDYEPLFRLG